MKPRLLVLDDERRMVDIIAMVLRREGYEVATCTDARLALEMLAQEPFDLLITDLRMPGPDGLEVLRRTRAASPELPVILMTAHASVSTAIAAMKEGAVDYVEKPFDNDELKSLVRRALDLTRLARENRYLRAELRHRYAVGQIVAASKSMQDVLALARRAAKSPSTVLVTGETGTGKELVARAVHFESERVGGPFVAVNCKAFSEGVLESELFDHERAPSPARIARARACSSRRTAGRSSSTRSARSGATSRRSCCACCRTRRFARWGATERAPSMCASWWRPTAICAPRSRRGAFARISTSGSR